jgi:dephospho-CoA kinase
MGTRLIAICGGRRCGKDTIAQRFVVHGYEHMKISKPLKDAIKCMFGFSDEELETNTKDAVHPDWGVSPRAMMQYIGTDIMQYHAQDHLPNIGREFWVRNFHKRLPEGSRVVISDLRFIHEYEYFKKHIPNFHIVKVSRQREYNSVIDSHASELEGSFIPYDFHIDNEGSLDELLAKVDAINQTISS